MTETSLETRALSRNFGALRAVREIDFKLGVGARHALIGPNGAGKTTFINLLTGALAPTQGRVLLAGRDITDKVQAERVKLGIARTFQINRLFRGLSVLKMSACRLPSGSAQHRRWFVQSGGEPTLSMNRCISWRL